MEGFGGGVQPAERRLHRRETRAFSAWSSASSARATPGRATTFVYLYASEIQDRSHWDIQKPGQISLLRVEKDRLGDKSAYRFFAGLDAQKPAALDGRLAKRQPVWRDAANGTHRIAVSYNAPLRRIC